MTQDQIINAIGCAGNELGIIVAMAHGATGEQRTALLVKLAQKINALDQWAEHLTLPPAPAGTRKRR